MFWDGSCRARPFPCAGSFEHAILERRRRFAFVTLQAELAPLGFDSRPGPPPFRIPSGKGRSCTFAHVAPIASHCIPESCDPVAILLAVCSCEVFEPIEVRFEVGLYTQASGPFLDLRGYLKFRSSEDPRFLRPIRVKALSPCPTY